MILPGLFLIGFGVGGMLTPSVNVVQSAFPEERQGEISDCPAACPTSGPHWARRSPARSLVANLADGNQRYEIALVVLGALGLIGLWAAWLLSRPTSPGVERIAQLSLDSDSLICVASSSALASIALEMKRLSALMLAATWSATFVA